MTANGNYYFAKKNFCGYPKNNLEKALHSYMATIDRSVIAKSDIGKFKQDVVEKVKELQALHPRCKSVKVDAVWSKMYNNRDIVFEACDSINFILYQSIN